MANKHAGICPYCGDNVTPVLIEENNIRRDVCKCPSCEKQLLICRTPARQLGRKGGRRRQMTESKIESAKKLLANGVPPRDVAMNLGVSVPTLYRWIPASGRV